jgi:hypothetical protein
VDNAEDAQLRFRTAISDRVKSDETPKESSEKSEVPQVQTAAAVQQPGPASSAPPPSVSDDTVHIQPSVKAASVEPTFKIDPPAVVPLKDNNVTVERTASPSPAAVPDTKEQVQEEEDTEKLLDLERQFNDMYEKNGENIEKCEYSFEVMDMIREIVKVCTL